MEHFLGIGPVLFKVSDDGNKILATIDKDAGLYLVIPFLCVVIEAAKPLLCHVVKEDVVSCLRTVFLQGVLNTCGECQTNISVRL